MQKYKFRKYSPEYRNFFKSEKKKLHNVIGTKAKIEHIGSTAIPGLGGKGIVDITIGIPNSSIEKIKTKLEEAGYEFREKASNTERFFFRIDYLNNHRKRRVHIHLTELNGRNWNEMISFRNYLLNHSEIVEKYIKVKKKAIKLSLGNGKKYRRYKGIFIQDILRNLPR